MFRVLSDIHLDSGSIRIISITRNTTKQDLFGIYVGFRSVRIHFYRVGFGLGFRVWFICPALSNTIGIAHTFLTSTLTFSLFSPTPPLTLFLFFFIQHLLLTYTFSFIHLFSYIFNCISVRKYFIFTFYSQYKNLFNLMEK